MKEVIPVGKNFYAIVDKDLAPGLRKFKWQPRVFRRCVYAVTYIGTGKNRIRLNMHRRIAQTKFGNVCHHKNHNTLDNRRENLENMSKKEHNAYHANDRILRQFEQTNTIKTSPPL